jgi:serine/threonine-protein kinase
VTTPADIRARLGDRYAIEGVLGEGGMGAVYLARDLRLDRLVALKVLRADLTHDVALRERFLRETRTAASFSHPNIVPVHAVEEREGVLALAMGYVEGESLADRVARSGPLDRRTAVRLLQDVAFALAYAHGRGIVHRDVKPENIMIERATGRALLMDFGIARARESRVDTAGLTRVGEVVGTPEYMSPEQASGDVVDGRSDLYSLGLVALFAISGQVVLAGASTQQTLVKQLTEMPPPAATLRPDLPAAFVDAIDRCVAKEPDARFATAEALLEAMDDAQLASREVPLPIRLFAHEAATLGLVGGFLVVLSVVVFRSLGTRVAMLDALIPAILLLAVGVTRAAQVLVEARRLREAGFSTSDILGGLSQVLAERSALRDARRADPSVRQRRRRTLLIAAAFVPVGLLLVWIAFSMRQQIGPNMYRSGPLGVTSVITGLILLTVAVVLFLRSPFRPSFAERLFRRVWLGLPGRAFLALAGRGVPSAPSGRVSPASRPAGTPVTVRSSGVNVATPASLEARLGAIETRLDRLERRADG